MEGGATGGYCQMGNCVIATPPIARMNSEITHAKMGRLIKNWAMEKCLVCAYLPAADAAAAGADAAAPGAPAAAGAPPAQGTGFTGAPGTIIFWKPSTRTWSPSFRPSRITHWLFW